MAGRGGFYRGEGLGVLRGGGARRGAGGGGGPNPGRGGRGKPPPGGGANFRGGAEGGTPPLGGGGSALPRLSRRDAARLRKRTAFVFQSYNLFLNKTALENVAEGLITARKIPRAEALDAARRALDKVGMLDRADHYPSQLSGGQQQRAAIARTIAAQPEIIYFDEPTSALDPELTGEVLSVMRQLADEGMTMLVVTHELGFARTVSSRTVFMEGGVVVESGPSRQMFESPREERTRAFLQTGA